MTNEVCIPKLELGNESVVTHGIYTKEHLYFTTTKLP